MASELRFETRVDLSGLNQGMAGGVSTVTSGSAQMAAAFKTSEQATKNLAQAVSMFAVQAEQGNAQAKAALQEYTAAAEQARAAVAALSQSEQAETVILGSNISARMAANAELRLMEGGIEGSTRAAAAFATMIPGVGAAAQAAFAIAGPVAFGMVVVDVGEKLVDFSQSATSLSTELGTDWLTGAIGQMNGLAAAVKGADDEISALAKDLDTVSKQTRDAQVENIRLTQGPAAGYRAQASDMQQQVARNEQMVTTLQQTAQAWAIAAKERDAYIDAKTGLFEDNGPTSKALEAAKELEKTNKQIVDYQRTDAALKLEATNLNLQADQVKPPKVAHGKDPNIALYRSMEVELDKEKVVRGESVKLDHDYWQQRIDTFEQGSSQYAAIQARITSEDVEGARKAHEAIAAFKKDSGESKSSEAADEAIAKFNRTVQQGAQDAEQAGAKWATYWSELTKGQEIATQTAAAMQIAQINAQLESGGITRLAADHELAAVRAQAFKDRISELTVELERLQRAYANLPKDPVTGATAGGGQLAGQIQNVKNQIALTQGQAQVSATNDTSKQAQDLAQPYVKAIDTINSDWLSMQNKLIFGTQNVKRAFANMGVSMLESVAGSFEKMLVTAATNELKMTVLHATQVQARLGTDAVGAATSTGIAHAANAEQGLGAAKVAFKNTYAQVSGWPVVGPVLAPILAGAAFAAVAAFETGGIVPNTGMALVHKNEAVLPAQLTSFLMNAAGNSTTSNSNSSSATMNAHFYGSSDQHFRRQMTRNATHTVKTLQRGMRNLGKA